MSTSGLGGRYCILWWCGVVWFGQEKKSQHLAESDERWSVVKEECVSLLKVGGDC